VYNPGRAIIKINNPFSTAIYRLYETATSAQPIKDTIGGDISVNVTESRSYYVSLTYGYCESARTEVKLFLSALTGDIINTFTPNGDGVNDYWVIKGLDTYPDATVKIFNRYGNSIFESVGYARPFDGNRNGKPLPAGVYYYIINLKRGDVLSGNVTIIR
jgi:gliding motility-associated-like protein